MKNLSPMDIVLITGGTGSLGQALIPRLLKRNVYDVRVLSRDEKKQADLRAEWPTVKFILGDVRDLRACQEAVRGVTVVIHGASLKYVDISERQPTEYVLTNVMGTINIINAALQEDTVETMIGISSDKACAPLNTYGLTKGLLEKLFIETHLARREKSRALPRFVVCRYGNVFASRGSVVPKWSERIKRGEKIRVTDPDMTRFFFTLDDAVDLIDYALSVDSGTIVAKAMPSARLGDLADVMAGPAGYEVIGQRPGEKTHEGLLSAFEMPRVIRSGDYFLYCPLSEPSKRHGPPYTSNTARRLTRAELMELTAPWR
jgi:UDP-N-acetylglucosamine 4,6-dehydratase